MDFFRTSLLAANLVAAAIVPGWAGATALTTAHGPVEIVKTPETVLTFDIGTLDTLDALEVAVAGVPDPIMLPTLAHLQESDLPKIGTLFEPDFEQVFALHPDLIIIGARSARQMDPLSKIAPTVDLTLPVDDLENAVVTQTRELGALFGKEEKGAELTAHLQDSLQTLRALVEGKGTALIVLTNGPKVSAYGPGSRFGWIHDTLGVAPVIEDLEVSTHGEAVSFEFLHETNPDWLIVLDRGAAIGADSQSAQATLDNELVASTTAMRKGQVIYLNAADVYVATTGIRSFQRTVDQFLTAFGG
ncbi:MULTISPECIES: siderophore ABC transporter substrate-binding protein [Actibacterium]|uniref:Iron complex transport system substrate-binding protein n=1 Tax=Actibacterium naphthalenivorans TaxID=1614693 RepID=A0A840CD23_9RHOB|nr:MULTISPECIES: siderophore ABC transporter substrate-binding protein [Actibacterium]ALG90859.1 hypothetical protein TQ29_12460 [Actibacterium sp. EMB200-NS6]MBB4023964.1 iron complex transport system substrate-binding protein [Actibacterium naphthalenivorans]